MRTDRCLETLTGLRPVVPLSYNSRGQPAQDSTAEALKELYIVENFVSAGKDARLES